MVDRTAGGSIVQESVDARIDLSDGTSITCPVNEIEPSEQGIRIGLRFLPWHRVVRYTCDLGSSGGGASAAPARVLVRVILEDGSAAGEVQEVSADQFEAGPWTLNLIVDTTSGDGRASRRKLFVPWHSVREYERLPRDAEVPDASTLIPPAGG